MELTEFAERVLYSNSLEEKLLLNPKSVSDEAVNRSFIMPEGPGRPKELLVSARGVKADFPGTNRLDNDRERGKMLHFLANHELLATELMALVLLKFPNAPKEFRMGVYETLKEEQAHTLMYMRRMKECGVEFGELPVNDYFWRLVAPMECPMDFVSRLSLVFEQANLDYSVHYAKLFRQVGDGGTAAVLEKIYEDEIGHVGHGLKWFRKWKEEGQTDWDAFQSQMHFPLSVVRAKGVAPYNAEGRVLAGLDQEWIDQLEVAEQSRGRTPVLHWFNPNAENEEMARLLAKPYTAKRNVQLLEDDLDLLPLAWARRDDVVLVKKMPGREHLKNLRSWGLPMPEFVALNDDAALKERRVGGMRPWAWQQRASDVLKPYSHTLSMQVKWQWREGMEPRMFSKKLGLELEEIIGASCGSWCESLEKVESAVSKLPGDVLIKAAYSNAGRGHLRLIGGNWTQSARGWIERVLREHGGVVVEPWLERVLDFSSQYERAADGSISHVGMTRVVNDDLGRFKGCLVLPKWAQGLNTELSQYLFKEAKVHQLYRYQMIEAITELMQGVDYVGPLGVDSMVFRNQQGGLEIRPVVEVNVRTTMGRVAVELLRKTVPGLGGFYQIMRKSQGETEALNFGPIVAEEANRRGLLAGRYVLNDPELAGEFLAVYTAAPPSELWQEVESC